MIGCGGRGNGAVENLLEAANGIKVHALGDVFADRVEGVRKNLKEKYNQEVPAENCFVGFDAYKQVIDSGVDMVILTTPPVFRTRREEVLQSSQTTLSMIFHLTQNIRQCQYHMLHGGCLSGRNQNDKQEIPWQTCIRSQW